MQDRSDDDYDDSSDAMSVDGGEDSQAGTLISENTPAGLSKSWKQLHAHVPMYTGGRLRFHDSYLLTLMSGDVSLSRADTGIQICTVRKTDDAPNDDDEDQGHDPDTITAYAVSAQTLITCSFNNILRQYTLSSTTTKPIVLSKVWGATGHSLPVTVMEFHGAYLATGSVDGSVRIWDARRAVLTHVLRGTAKVTTIQWRRQEASSSLLLVAVGRESGSLEVHDLLRTENTIVANLQDHESAVTAIAWHGPWMVSGGRDSVVNLWDATSYAKLHTLAVLEQVEGLVFWKLPSREAVVATAGSKGIVRLWSIEKRTKQLKQLAQQSTADCFGSDRGGYLQLDVRNETNQLVVSDAEHNILYVSAQMEAEGRSDSSCHLSTDQTVVGNNDEILDLKVFPKSDRCVVATNSHLVRIFDTNNFSCQVLDGHTDTVLCVDLSPCGNIIATCGKDKTMRLWNQSLECVAVAEGHTEAVGATALSRKEGKYQVGGKAARNGGGAFALTVSADRTLKRWNLPSIDETQQGSVISLQAARSTQAHEKDINIVSVAPNDSLIATGSQDKTVRLWTATDLSLVTTLKGHRRGVWDCQFSPHDRVLATASGDKTIKLWSLSSDYGCVRTFQGHVASVLRLRFISHGLQLVSAGGDGLLKVWTVRTNECETTMDLHTGKVWAMDVSSDGKRVMSGGGDARLVVWKDATIETEAAERAEQEEAILIDQQLANLLRQKDYKKALHIALDRGKPYNALKILEKIVEEDAKQCVDSLKTLQTIIARWPVEKVVRIMQYARDWNTKARNSHVAMLLMKAIVTSFPVQRLIAVEEVPEIVAAILPYTERHFNRLDRLHSDTYLLDFVLASMGTMEDGDQGDFNRWEAASHKRLVMPPKKMQGRVDVGAQLSNTDNDDDESDTVVTVGDSSSDSE